MKKIKLLLASIGGLTLLPTCLVPVVTSCNNQDVQVSDLINKLQSVDSVKQVNVIKYPNNDFKYKLVVKIEQPVSWQDKTKGTFLQRVEFGFKSYSAINVLNCNGYTINNALFGRECRNELVKRYEANYINVEYRYFGESLPTFYNPRVTSTWEHLTLENGIEDLHAIITVFKTFLTGKWISVGGSKGGQNTNLYAMTYPNDCAAYISCVAPRCFGMSEKSKMTDWVTNSIGKDSPITEKAATFRLEVLKLQNYLLTESVALDIGTEYYNRSIAVNSYVDYVYDHKLCLYYLDVIDLSIGLWQLAKTPGELPEEITKINKMEPGTAKLTASKEFFFNLYSTNNLCFSDYHYPYYVQAYKQMGIYNSSMSVINDAFEKASLTKISLQDIPEEDYDTLTYKVIFTNDFLDNITHDDTVGSKLEQWNSTGNQANVIMLYGLLDPWYVYALPKSSLSNIHIFVNQLSSHATTISTLPQEDQDKAWALIDGWVK